MTISVYNGLPPFHSDDDSGGTHFQSSRQLSELGDIVTCIAFLLHPVPSTIFLIAIVMLEVATPG